MFKLLSAFPKTSEYRITHFEKHCFLLSVQGTGRECWGGRVFFEKRMQMLTKLE